MKRFQRGFSLIELVIIVVILGILAAIAVPQLSKEQKVQAAMAQTESARLSRAPTRMEQLEELKVRFKETDLKTASAAEIRIVWSEYIDRHGTHADLVALSVTTDDQIRSKFQNFLNGD